MIKFDRKEIVWNIINSLLAGALVFFGAFSTGEITYQSIIIAIGATFIVAISQFKEYWSGEKKERCNKIFNFVKI